MVAVVRVAVVVVGVVNKTTMTETTNAVIINVANSSYALRKNEIKLTKKQQCSCVFSSGVCESIY